MSAKALRFLPKRPGRNDKTAESEFTASLAIYGLFTGVPCFTAMTGMQPADEPLKTEYSFNASFASYAFFLTEGILVFHNIKHL